MKSDNTCFLECWNMKLMDIPACSILWSLLFICFAFLSEVPWSVFRGWNTKVSTINNIWNILTIFGIIKNRFIYIPVAFFPFFLLFVCSAFSLEVFRSVQDGNEIHSHAVKTNKEAFMRKKIDKKRHLKNRKLKQQKKRI